MSTIKVAIEDHPYKIHIGSWNLRFLFPEIKDLIPSRKYVLLTNRTIYRMYKRRIEGVLGRLPKVDWIVIQDGERFKNLKTMEYIYNKLVKFGADRKTGLIAIGGGVVGDMGGFAAASYLRGIPYVQVPTTLLSQVDSSVGGKTGIDLASGKNLVGAFYQPKLVLIDTDFLDTLPKREFRCGLAEVVKYGAIWDFEFFKYLENNADKILNYHPKVLEYIIRRSCEIKAEVVKNDEKEQSGLRALLNFGHTMGHAIETLSGYNKIHHGEGVSMGMVYAARVSQALGLCEDDVPERLIRLLKKFRLPTQWPKFAKKDLKKVVSIDKKAEGGTIKYVVLKKLGKASLRPMIPDEILKYL